jgi:methionyl-tRNA formyltransferase
VRILVVADEAAGLQALRKVAESADHDLVAVMASGEPLRRAASEAGAPVWEPREVRDPVLADRLGGVDALLNVHSLFRIHPAVLEAPAVGSFNLHPGPLPAYAGLNAPSWAIYFGETRHAATLHWMTEEIDAGRIAYEEWFDIEDDDTGLTLSAQCARHGLGLVDRLLEDLPDVPARDQEGEGRYFGPAVPHGGRLPWALPARRIVDFVRACDYGPFGSPWGRPIAGLDGTDVEVLAASLTGEPVSEPPGTIASAGRVAAGDEWIVVERVRIEGATLDGSDALEPGRIFDAEQVSETTDRG